MALLSLESVAKTYDANRPLLTDVSLVVRGDDALGLIGPNGSGKSTLLRLLAGLETPDAGRRTLRRGTRIGYLEQEPRFDPELTLRAIVRGGIEGREALLAEIAEVHQALAEPEAQEKRLESLLARQERLQVRLEALGGHDVEHRVEAMIDGVGLPDPEALCGSLSGGEARRVALARLLVSAPDLLLLDEPTNHLDTFVVAWLEERLAQLETPLILVTHDRYLLDRVARRIVEIDRGRAYSYDGGYGRYVSLRAERLATEERVENTRLTQLRRETEWMKRGPLARTSKAKARIARYETLVASVPLPPPEELSMAFPRGPRLGAKVIALEGVSHAYGDREVLPPFDLEIEPGMRLGIVGPNGAGKSTLLEILLGRLEPSTGSVQVGETVRVATIDQSRSDLDPDKTVVREVAGEAEHVVVGEHRLHVASFLDRFLFPGPRKEVRVGSLSGGERGRILLAKLMLQGANVLVLDEPTNDLDLTTLRALEEALCAFEGSLVVVSHDRWFLDRVATHVLHVDGAQSPRLYPGGATELIDRLAAEKAARPQPAKSSPAQPRKQASAGKPKRLSNWEEKELEELTESISELEGQLGALDERLADPELYKGDGSAARELQAERTATQEHLETSLARWETLASRAE